MQNLTFNHDQIESKNYLISYNSYIEVEWPNELSCSNLNFYLFELSSLL